MKKNFAKVLSVFLAVLMLMSFVPITSFAATTVANGTCGDNLIWTVDGEGTLTISGTGNMDSYHTAEQLPWYSVCESIQKVIIEDGVEYISGSIFSGCLSLVSISIAGSVYFNTSGAFTGCPALTEINVLDDSGAYHSIDGVLYADYANGHKLVCYPAGKQAKQFVVPDFVTEIRMRAFEGCTALEEVIISANVNSLGSYAFRNCASLSSVKFEENSKLAEIGEAAFENCTKLAKIDIPDNVTFIWCNCVDNTAYYNNESNWVNGVLYVGNHLLRAKPEISGAYTVKEGTKSIAMYAFYACQNLTDISIPDSVLSIGAYAFYGTAVYNNEKNLTDGCLYIDNHLIAYLYRDEQFSIKEGTKSIAMDALYALEAESVTIPSSVTGISHAAFAHSTISSVIFEENSQLTYIGQFAFSNCTSLAQLNLPDSVKTIDKSAFSECSSLTSVYIPTGVTKIGSDAFSECTALSAVYIKDIDAWCNIYFPDMLSSPLTVCLMNGENSPLYLNNEPITEITITSSKGKEINDYALMYCFSLTNVSIKSGIRRIGKFAFGACTSLTSVEIPKDVTIIDDDAFNYCFSLTDVYYSGTEDDWAAISIGINNDCLLNATIHFNSSDEECKHIPGSFTQPESCTVNGYTLVFCEICGETLEYTIIDAAHQWGEYSVTKAATCTATGTETRICERCGEDENREIPVTDHNFSDIWTIDTDSTCTQEGVQTRHCKNCTETTDAMPVAKKDHSWGEWYVVVEPTLTSKGSKERSCTVCTATETETIPMLVTKVFTDEKTGITVETNRAAYNGQDITVTVEEVFDGSHFLAQAYGKMQTWNLKTYINGEQVQPEVPVYVRIPLPEGFNPNRIFVYHVNSQTKELEVLDAQIIDGYICFTTSSFSLFIIVDESSLIVPPEDDSNNSDVPDEPFESCDHICHKTGFMGFIWKIVQFFWKLFNMNPVCECGLAHY
ncbi:MAG: leucine-rich repeat protein [Clostridia bacterium]|nr:leucine-rich repeat protein [Clostridia bacterium]